MSYTATITREGHVVALLSRNSRPYSQEDADLYPGCVMLTAGTQFVGAAKEVSSLEQLQDQLDALEEQRAKGIRKLRAIVAAALIGNGWSQDDTMLAGRSFFGDHGHAIRAYVDGAAPKFAEDVVGDDRAWLGLFASPGVTIREVILAHVA